MPDDLKKRDIQDRAPISTRRISTRLISMGEEREVRYWTKALGVSREELAEAISRVGNSVDAVRHELGK
jgi:hypothetical protein